MCSRVDTRAAPTVPDCAGSTALHAALTRRLAGAMGARVFLDPPAHIEELVERVGGADTVLHYFKGRRLDARTLARARPARVVVMGPLGESVDVEAAGSLGIEVYDTPGLAIAAVAEHTLALMLALSRRIVSAHARMLEGGWEPAYGRELGGRQLGVVGLGRIGRRVAAAAQVLGMNVVAWSRNSVSAPKGVRMGALDDLLRTSDVVTLHARLGPDSSGMIDRRRIALLKGDALLINTARAQLLDMDALRLALRAGRLGGAALDVFEREPLTREDPLRTDPNVLLTPHMAWMTSEAIERFVSAAVAFTCGGDAAGVARVI